jgi:hypothetical protein
VSTEPGQLQKAKLDPNWFVGRLKALDEYQTALRHAMGIGRALGDAFAWFFYQRSNQLLAEHLRSPRLVNFPSGSGGEGELAIVRKMPTFGGHLVIHHSVTSILRIGDISLVDISALEVVALGEVKSKREDETTFRGTLTVVAEQEIDIDVTPGGDDENFERPEWIERKLRKQLRKMDRALAVQDAPESRAETRASGTLTKRIVELADKAEPGMPAVQLIDPSLVAAVVRLPTCGLWKRLTASLHELEAFDEIAQVATELFAHPSEWNGLYVVDPLFNDLGQPRFVIGTLPWMWTGTPLDVLRDFYLRRAVPIVLFNPAELVRGLQERGFKMRRNGNHFLDLIAEREVEGRMITMSGFRYYAELIVACYMSTAEVLDLVDTFVTHANDMSAGKGNTEIHLDMRTLWGIPA